MRSAVGREVVTLDCAGKTLTDRDTGHVNLLADREHFHGQRGTHLQIGELISIDMELFEHFACFDAGLSIVTGKRLAHARRLLRAECNLNGIVSVGFFRLHLRDTVAVHFEHRHRNGFTILGKDARHADLTTD